MYTCTTFYVLVCVHVEMYTTGYVHVDVYACEHACVHIQEYEIPKKRGPTDHINMRIEHSGCKAQYDGIPGLRSCRLLVSGVFSAPEVSGLLFWCHCIPAAGCRPGVPLFADDRGCERLQILG